MKKNLLLRSAAENDIIQAFNWYNDRLTGLGNEFLSSINEAIELISQSPESYPMIYKNIRRILVKRFPFSILFINEESRIVVIAVFHFKRNPTSWFKSMK
jgi:toxin ParE1/3/4